jgi:hypothetical protein
MYYYNTNRGNIRKHSQTEMPSLNRSISSEHFSCRCGCVENSISLAGHQLPGTESAVSWSISNKRLASWRGMFCSPLMLLRHVLTTHSEVLLSKLKRKKSGAHLSFSYLRHVFLPDWEETTIDWALLSQIWREDEFLESTMNDLLPVETCVRINSSQGVLWILRR